MFLLTEHVVMYASPCRLAEKGAKKKNDIKKVEPRQLKEDDVKGSTSKTDEEKDDLDAKKRKHVEKVKNLARELNEGDGLDASQHLALGANNGTHITGTENAVGTFASGAQRRLTGDKNYR